MRVLVFRYIQGAVNLITMTEHTGVLQLAFNSHFGKLKVASSTDAGGHVVIPKSHLCFREIMDKHNIDTKGFPVPPTEPLLATAVMPHCEAGDMLVRRLYCTLFAFVRNSNLHEFVTLVAAIRLTNVAVLCSWHHPWTCCRCRN